MRKRIWIPEAPLLNLRRYREIEYVQSTVRLEGWFTVELIHARTGIVARQLRFRNMLVDAGMDAFGNERVNQLANYFAVGTANTPPAVTDSALGTELARTNSNGGFADTVGIAAANEYVWVKRTRSFTTAQANGNLTEVGAFQNSVGAPMLCRQLLKDELGAPTTITKTSEFELRVIYEFRAYTNLDDVVYAATVNGASMNITTRVCGLTDDRRWSALNCYPGKVSLPSATYAATYSGGAAGLGPVTGVPTGTADYIGVGSVVISAYIPGTYYRDATLTWTADLANRPDIRAFTAGGDCFSHQHLLAETISKVNTQKLVLAVRQSWARA